MDDVLAEALRLRALGFAIHWLRAREKAPFANGWASAPIASVTELAETYRRGYNVGFRPGEFSIVDGGEIVVLDVDVRGGQAFADEAYAAAKSIMGGDFLPNVASGSGAGRHQYMKFKRGTSPKHAATVIRQADIWVSREGQLGRTRGEGAKPAWMIELLSTGKNVVLPPSIHPDTGAPYTWIRKP
jgi:hypothetical protein